MAKILSNSVSKDSIEEIGELMKRGDATSIEKIMDKFIIKDKNLILKTDIENAKNFTVLLLMISELRKKGLKRSANTLQKFCERYIEVRVSSGRLSWKYIFDAISAIKRENANTTIGAKLLGVGGENK